MFGNSNKDMFLEVKMNNEVRYDVYLDILFMVSMYVIYKLFVFNLGMLYSFKLSITL